MGESLRVRDTFGRVVLTLNLVDVVARDESKAPKLASQPPSMKPPCATCLELEHWRPPLE